MVVVCYVSIWALLKHLARESSLFGGAGSKQAHAAPTVCRLCADWLASSQVHLALDTSGAGGHMSVRAFVSRTLGLGGRELAREFLEVDCEVRGGEAERVSIDLLR